MLAVYTVRETLRGDLSAHSVSSVGFQSHATNIYLTLLSDSQFQHDGERLKDKLLKPKTSSSYLNLSNQSNASVALV